MKMTWKIILMGMLTVAGCFQYSIALESTANTVELEHAKAYPFSTDPTVSFDSFIMMFREKYKHLDIPRIEAYNAPFSLDHF